VITPDQVGRLSAFNRKEWWLVAPINQYAYAGYSVLSIQVIMTKPLGKYLTVLSLKAEAETGTPMRDVSDPSD